MNDKTSSQITRENFNDMINTSIAGKLFLTQALLDNLKASPKKARVFNVGAPFADGWMAIPGWGGYGIAKAGMKYLNEVLKVTFPTKGVVVAPKNFTPKNHIAFSSQSVLRTIPT